MAAGAAMEMGYTNIVIYQAGMPDWLSKGNPAQKGSKPGKLK
jgi:rhodanese-related sulfurtransferase